MKIWLVPVSNYSSNLRETRWDNIVASNIFGCSKRSNSKSNTNISTGLSIWPKEMEEPWHRQ